MIRHFLDLFDLSADEARGLVDRSLSLKVREPERASLGAVCAGRTLGLLFEKPSLRTRVSFEAAIAQLGGNAIFLRGKDVGLGQRESVADFARVISQYVDALAVRTFAHATIEELARHATIPVINALSERGAPLPGDGRHADDPRGGRPARWGQAGLRRRRQQRGAVAGRRLGAARASSSCWRLRKATSSRPTSSPGSRRGSRRTARSSTIPAQAVRGRRRLHRRLGQHGPGARGRSAAPDLRAVPGQRRP